MTVAVRKGESHPLLPEVVEAVEAAAAQAGSHLAQRRASALKFRTARCTRPHTPAGRNPELSDIVLPIGVSCARAGGRQNCYAE